MYSINSASPGAVIVKGQVWIDCMPRTCDTLHIVVAAENLTFNQQSMSKGRKLDSNCFENRIIVNIETR